MIKLFKTIDEVPNDFVGKCLIIREDKQRIQFFSYNRSNSTATGRHTIE